MFVREGRISSNLRAILFVDETIIISLRNPKRCGWRRLSRGDTVEAVCDAAAARSISRRTAAIFSLQTGFLWEKWLKNNDMLIKVLQICEGMTY